MVVHSGLYIPASSRIHPSQLDFVIMAGALICCLSNMLVQSHPRKGRLFFERTFLVNKCFLAMFVQVLFCFAIQYYDESFDCAKVFCRRLFSSFYTNSQLWLQESLPTVFHDQGKRILYSTL